MKFPQCRRWMLVLSVPLLAGAAGVFAQPAGLVVIDGRMAAPPAAQPAPPATPLPADAREVVDQFEKDRVKAVEEMEAKLAPKRKELIAQLKALQDRHTKAGELDEAVAIRDRLRELTKDTGGDPDAPLADPGNLVAYRNQVGKSFYFSVVGTIEGTVWGSDVYTDDSPLALAAVHAGIAKPNQRTVVRVFILPARDNYESSSKNGVDSAAYGAFQGSYRIEEGPAKVETPAKK